MNRLSWVKRNFRILNAIENSLYNVEFFFLLFHTSAAAKWNQNVHFGNAYVGNQSEVGQNTSARTRLIEKVKSPIFAKSSRFIFFECARARLRIGPFQFLWGFSHVARLFRLFQPFDSAFSILYSVFDTVINKPFGNRFLYIVIVLGFF